MKYAKTYGDFEKYEIELLIILSFHAQLKSNSTNGDDRKPKKLLTVEYAGVRCIQVRAVQFCSLSKGNWARIAAGVRMTHGSGWVLVYTRCLYSLQRGLFVWIVCKNITSGQFPVKGIITAFRSSFHSFEIWEDIGMTSVTIHNQKVIPYFPMDVGKSSKVYHLFKRGLTSSLRGWQDQDNTLLCKTGARKKCLRQPQMNGTACKNNLRLTVKDDYLRFP